MVVRISKGRFDPRQAADMQRLLRESETALRPALRALPGLLAYHVGIDVAASVLTNTSIWQSSDHAIQMDSLREMQELRTRFEALGVQFEPITNHEVLWSV